MHPEVDRLTAIYCLQLSQCMRHKPRQPSQVAGEPCVSYSQPNQSKSGTEFKCARYDHQTAGSEIWAVDRKRPTSSSHSPSFTPTPCGWADASRDYGSFKLSIVSSELGVICPHTSKRRTSPRDDGGEGEEANVADDTILDAPPVESPRLGQREQDRSHRGMG